MNKPIRLDIYLTKFEKIQSRNKASELIKNKQIKINNNIITKPSFKVEENMKVEILQDEFFVSRAAYKLKYFLDDITLDIHGLDTLDIGSSTGGFTQVLLENDVKEVTAVDVGKEQLHKSIKEDNRVYSYESCDIRKFESEKKFNLVVSDVSFISLLYILDDVDRLATNAIILLFKPQFEVGREARRDNHGVVLDEESITKAMNKFEKTCLSTYSLETALSGTDTRYFGIAPRVGQGNRRQLHSSPRGNRSTY